MENKFKDTMGRWRTQSLFFEQTYSPDAIYTMQEEDRDGRPSFRRLYMEISDPSEYRVANELLGGYAHWQALCRSEWFQDYISGLREELEVKIRSEGVLRMQMLMNSDKNTALAAAKFFAEGKYKEKRGRGRPSNAEVAAETKKQARINQRVADDAARLGLSVITNDEPE